MPSAVVQPAPQPGWAVLLYGPPPDLELLARELDGSGLAVIQIAGHSFLQAPEIFDPLSWPEEVAWAGAAILQQLNGAIRLRYAVRPPLHCGPAVLSDRGGRFPPDAIERAVAEVRAASPRPFQLSLGEIWTATRNRPPLGRALDLFLLGSAAWNLRETFEEAWRDLGPEAESWIAAQGWAGECAWFRWTVDGSTPRRPGLSRRRSRFPQPQNHPTRMPPLTANNFVRRVLEELVRLRLAESRA
jgi:hypothetical protein